MASKNTAAFGIYADQRSVEDSVEALKRAGFRNTDISVLFPDNAGTKDFAHEKHTKAPEGATTGGLSGGIIGGALGWLVGIGALAIPGIGPFVAAGPIVAALSGVGVGGAIGGLAGALIGVGIPEYEAKRYEGRIRSGGILLSVHCDSSDWTKRAKEVLEESGATDIATSTEARADFASHERPHPRRVTETERVENDLARARRVAEEDRVDDDLERARARRVTESERVAETERVENE